MLKKFKDFDVKQYKLKSILEKLEVENESVGFDETLLDTPISDNKYLLKFTKVIMKAFKKAGIENYVPYGTLVYLNGVPGVWFSDTEGTGKSIVVCRNQYTKVISIFDDFKPSGKNQARITYSSEKLGILDMINQVIETLLGTGLNEGLVMEAASRFGSAGYGMKHIKTVAGWTDSMKEFVVELLKGLSPSKAAGEILKNVSSNPICADIYDSFGKKDSTIKYATYIIYDAMNHTVPEVEGVLDGKLASVAPAMRMSVLDDFDTEAHELEKAEIRKKELEKAQKDFEESTQMIKDIVDTFCHYVKQNGQLDEDDASVFTTKGLYITGRAGSGKSYALNQTLKKNGMVNKKDYIEVGNGATDADALYRLMYKYNGKLIILDDAANVVGGSKRIAFWKALLQTDPKPIHNPRETRDNSSQFYEVGKKTRQERYFAEIGEKSNDEKNEFFKKKRREYSDLTKKMSSKDVDNMIAAEWEDQKKNTRPLIPDEYLFTGCVVVIGNMTPAELQKVVVQDGGEQDWAAVRQRFQPIEINPPYEVLWNAIQKQLREQQAMSEEELPSYSCIVPREYVDEFVEEVNYLIEGNEGPEFTGVSWRMATQIGQAFKGEKGRRMWKRRLREILRTT